MSSIPFKVIEYITFSFLCSAIEAKPPEYGRKWRAKFLNTRLPSYFALCAIQREGKTNKAI